MAAVKVESLAQFAVPVISTTHIAPKAAIQKGFRELLQSFGLVPLFFGSANTF